MKKYEAMFLFDPTFAADGGGAENEIRRIMDQIHAALGNQSYFLLDHTNQDGGKDDTRPDKSRQYGSSGKHQVADVVFMIKPSEPIWNDATGENELVSMTSELREG